MGIVDWVKNTNIGRYLYGTTISILTLAAVASGCANKNDAALLAEYNAAPITDSVNKSVGRLKEFYQEAPHNTAVNVRYWGKDESMETRFTFWFEGDTLYLMKQERDYNTGTPTDSKTYRVIDTPPYGLNPAQKDVLIKDFFGKYFTFYNYRTSSIEDGRFMQDNGKLTTATKIHELGTGDPFFDYNSELKSLVTAIVNDHPQSYCKEKPRMEELLK